jgi:hypothetical protein
MEAHPPVQMQPSRGARALQFARGLLEPPADGDESDSVLAGALVAAAVLTVAFAAFTAFLWSAVALGNGNTGASKSDQHAYWFLPLGLSLLGGAIGALALRRTRSAPALATVAVAVGAVVYLLVVCPYY